MLAEKFFLFLETLISRASAPTATYPDGGPKVISQSQFVPIKLPDAGYQRQRVKSVGDVLAWRDERSTDIITRPQTPPGAT